jgi:lysozyme
MRINESLIPAISEDLIRHEGFVNKIYLDTNGLHAMGIGHLIKLGDEEFKRPVGEAVSEERIREAFKQDLVNAIRDVEDVFPLVADYPANVQRVLVNMMFNLGRPRFNKFEDMIAAVRNGDWDAASNAMKDSKWYGQVKGRAVELVDMMRNA